MRLPDADEARLAQVIRSRQIQAEQLLFETSCHSVAEAAASVHAQPEDFVKNLCLVTASNELVVAIVKGEDRASTSTIGKVLGTPTPRLATPAEIFERTGYPCGGTPSFGYEARFLIDERVLEKEIVYSGGGSENSLVKITPQELLRANLGQVAKIRK